jgi:hypothetical protein
MSAAATSAGRAQPRDTSRTPASDTAAPPVVSTATVQAEAAIADHATTRRAALRVRTQQQYQRTAAFACLLERPRGNYDAPYEPYTIGDLVSR